MSIYSEAVLINPAEWSLMLGIAVRRMLRICPTFAVSAVELMFGRKEYGWFNRFFQQ